jgi:hypothetical protein
VLLGDHPSHLTNPRRQDVKTPTRNVPEGDVVSMLELEASKGGVRAYFS